MCSTTHAFFTVFVCLFPPFHSSLRFEREHATPTLPSSYYLVLLADVAHAEDDHKHGQESIRNAQNHHIADEHVELSRADLQEVREELLHLAARFAVGVIVRACDVTARVSSMHPSKFPRAHALDLVEDEGREAVVHDRDVLDPAQASGHGAALVQHAREEDHGRDDQGDCLLRGF